MSKVLHVIDAATPRDCLWQLQLLLRAGDAVVSVGPAPETPPLPVPVEPLHVPLGSAGLAGPRLARRAGDARVLHAWSPRAAEAAVAAAERNGAEVLLTLPAAPPRGTLLELTDGGRVRLVVPTQAARMELLARGAAAECVAVLPPPGRPPANRDARRKRVRSELGIGDDVTLLVAPAEMTRDAGHAYASWAHGILRQAISNVCLMLPGGGPAEKHAKFFAHTTGYDSEVFITGERFDMDDSLCAADAAVFLQSCDSGLAAMVRTMSADLPIMTVRTPDALECLGDMDPAVLVEPGIPRQHAAAMLRLVEDKALTQPLRHALARRAATRHDPLACRETLDIIHARVSSVGRAAGSQP